MSPLAILVIFGTQLIVINSRPTLTLRNEVDQFKDVINFERIKEIIREYYENDAPLQHLINYMRSEKFVNALNVLMESEEVDDITEWMKTHGVDLKTLLSQFEEEISGAYRPATLQNFLGENFSYKTFEDEIRNEVNYEKMSELIDGLIADGNDFAHLYLILNVDRPALENTFGNPEIQDVLEGLKKLGVNVEYLRTVIYEVLRWN